MPLGDLQQADYDWRLIRPMRRFPLVLSSLSLGVCVVVGAGSAHGDDKESVSARLSWQRLPGAESCIDASSLEAAINRRWRRKVFVEDRSAELIVEGKVGR